MTENSIVKWLRFSFVSLAIVALYGTVMRYKIAFNLPVFEQKNLLHAHSHFAFSGWISHILYCALVITLIPVQRQKKYTVLIILNLLSAFGMLIAFTIQGYKVISISFSVLSMVISTLFAYHFIVDLRRLPGQFVLKAWVTTAMVLNVISCAGPLSLAYMIGTKQVDVDFYLASVYYYLHFQYNGWFFFASMALVVARLPENFPSLKMYYVAFASTVIPTFFLSVLWMNLPVWIYIITGIAATLQSGIWIAWVIKVHVHYKRQRQQLVPEWTRIFFYSAGLAVTIKFLLQTISIVPSLSQLVFGIRPIIIAYLHLVLLGVYSLFLMGWLFCAGRSITNRLLKGAALIFLWAVVINELLLAIQGFSAFTYTSIPGLNYLLLGAALALLGSASALAIFSNRHPR